MLETPVYIFTGFLEAGKTTFIKRLLSNPDFITGEKTLIILCEEGIEELKSSLLEFNNACIYIIESEEDFTKEILKKLDEKYKPERVLVEYNCMWNFETILNIDLPEWWKKTQIGAIVDASTFKLYMNNLRTIMAEQFRNADFVLFNRCDEYINKLALRGSVKAINSKAQVIFQLKNGEIDSSEDQLPYDINSDVIDVKEYDFGLWYVDINNSIKKYIGKKIDLIGEVIIPDKYPKEFFILRRKAMTCCAKDVSMLGVLCKLKCDNSLKNRTWIKLRGLINSSYLKKRKTYIPVLMVEKINYIEPPADDYIYFY